VELTNLNKKIKIIVSGEKARQLAAPAENRQ
jgi:hypothetical protein